MQTRHFIATVVAAALTITGLTASNAQAGPDADDIAKLLFGTAAIVIIGKALDDNNKNKPRRVYEAPTRRYEPIRQTYATPRPVVRNNPYRSNRTLPASCKRDYITVRGERTRGFGQRCLSRSNYSMGHLPRACERRVDTRRGVDTIYSARCLHSSGYRVTGW